MENEVKFDKDFFEKNYVAKKAVAVDFLKLHGRLVNMSFVLLFYCILLVGFTKFSFVLGVVGALILGVALGLVLINSRNEIARISTLYGVEPPKTVLHYIKNMGDSKNE